MERRDFLVATAGLIAASAVPALAVAEPVEVIRGLNLSISGQHTGFYRFFVRSFPGWPKEWVRTEWTSGITDIVIPSRRAFYGYLASLDITKVLRREKFTDTESQEISVYKFRVILAMSGMEWEERSLDASSFINVPR